MVPTRPLNIVLRRTTTADVPALFGFECDPAANALAGTKPRDWDAFRSRWNQILSDPEGAVTRVTPRVILADGLLVGAVNISPHEGADSIGYWIAKDHWGRGIASRAVALMLNEYHARPLVAQVAAQNQPSLRVLEKNGFVVVSRLHTPETPRCQARETVNLILH